MHCAVEQAVVPVVEGAPDIKGVRGAGGQADPFGERCGDRGAREDCGALAPYPLGHHRPHLERCDLEPGNLRPTGHERHVLLAEGKRHVDVLGEAEDEGCCPQQSLLGVAMPVRDGTVDVAQRLASAVEAEPSLDECVGNRNGQWVGEAIAHLGSEYLAQQRRDVGHGTDEERVFHHSPQCLRNASEPTRSDRHAHGVAHHVLELVCLVEDHHIVVRQDRSVAGHVEPVQEGVHDGDICNRGAGASGLGEALCTHRAALAARALLAADAHLGPRPVRGGPVELGLVAGLGDSGPVGQPLDLHADLARQVIDRRNPEVEHPLAGTGAVAVG